MKYSGADLQVCIELIRPDGAKGEMQCLGPVTRVNEARAQEAVDVGEAASWCFAVYWWRFADGEAVHIGDYAGTDAGRELAREVYDAAQCYARAAIDAKA